MKNIILIFALFVLGSQVFGVEVFYPKYPNVQINSERTFFIGNSDVEVKINGKVIQRNLQGAFAYVVPLELGENTFVIEDSKVKITYTITRCNTNFQSTNREFRAFNETEVMKTAVANSPLRAIPDDNGERITHLDKGVHVKLIGKQNDFYKVQLADNISAWIAQNLLCRCTDSTTALLTGYDYIDSEDYFTFIFHTTKKIPYIITENPSLAIRFFNVESTKLPEFDYKEATGTSQLFGYKGHYNNNNQFVWEIRKPPIIDPAQPLQNIKITLDAGHGGREKGAISCFGDKEKDINLAITKYLQKELTSRGAKVFMTRKGDDTLSLSERIKYTNKNDAMISISIHGNAIPDSLNPNKHRGTSLYYYYDMAQPLAQCIQQEMTDQLGTENDGVHYRSFAMTRNSEALSVLIEVGYLINPDDCVLLRDENFQKAAAKAIANGVEKFFLKSRINS